MLAFSSYGYTAQITFLELPFIFPNGDSTIRGQSSFWNQFLEQLSVFAVYELKLYIGLQRFYVLFFNGDHSFLLHLYDP